MECKQNYAKINDEGKLEIHTDNAMFVNGETFTEFSNRNFVISGDDLLRIYALFQDKEITTLLNIRKGCGYTTINNYVVVGKDVEKRRLMKMYVKLLNEVEEINKTRHWWERKIKIDNEL